MADEDGVGQGGGNLGDVLLRNDLVSESELEEAKAEAAKGGAGLTGALARLGYVKETQLVEFLSRQYGVPSINLEEVEVEEDVIEMIPQDVAERHGIIPIDKHGSTIVVAMTDPSNIYAMDDIKFLTGFDVEAVVTTEASIESALERYYGGSSGDEIFEDVDVDEVDFMSESASDLDLDNLEDEAGEAPVVRLCNVVLVDAIKRGASDIHIEPYEKEFRIRYRIDGVLYEICLLYTSPSPRDRQKSRMPSSA